MRLRAPLCAVLALLVLSESAVAADPPLPPRRPPPAEPFRVEPPPPDGPVVPIPPRRRIAPAPPLVEATAPAAPQAPQAPALPAPTATPARVAPPPTRTQPPRTAATAGEQIVCADPRIVGRRVPPVSGRIAGCMIAAPVEVLRISGIRMSRAATLDCRTARTFANWLTGVVEPAIRREMNSGLARVWVMGSYACRTRNNRPGARLSEHSGGRAIDIGGFTLTDGRRIQVLRHWASGAQGRVLREVWKQACGSFTTVLGPQADRFHKDHLHLDTANRRNSYCR